MINSRPSFIWTLTTPPPLFLGNWVHIPFIKTVQISNAITATMVAETRSVVVTSRKAAQGLVTLASRRPDLPVIAVGPATADTLKQFGFQRVTVPAVYTAEGVIQLLETSPLPEPILFPRGDLGGERLLNYFKQQQLTHFCPVVYETHELPAHEIRQALSAIEILEIVAFGSPSTVKVWLKVAEALDSTPNIATLGPTTAVACKEADISVWLEGTGEAEELIKSVNEKFEIIR